MKDKSKQEVKMKEEMIASSEATILDEGVLCQECAGPILPGQLAFEKFYTESDDLEFLCETCRSMHP